MVTLFKEWKGCAKVNEQFFDSISKVDFSGLKTGDQFHIILTHTAATTANNMIKTVSVASKTEYRISVKKYMTQKSSPEFTFMSKWNNDNPMPLRTMIGTIEKETSGMVYMKLHGDIYAKQICTCMKCGKTLTNPVSQYFGIGPECGGHGYVNPFDSEDELKEAVEAYRAKLQKITWEGWIIKSAITEREEV